AIRVLMMSTNEREEFGHVGWGQYHMGRSGRGIGYCSCVCVCAQEMAGVRDGFLAGKGVGLLYLVAYSDADWAGCLTTWRSTLGYCVFLGNNLLSWSSKRQPKLSRSGAEVESGGVANVVSKTYWLRNLQCELHTPLSSVMLVYCDNILDTAYRSSWLLVKCRHRYAVSSLMDMAYRMSEQFL
nr:ribonuclease H-like domain-containing protein [Tanacetum cinerariifolium]